MHRRSIRLGTTGWARWSTGRLQVIEIWPYEQMLYAQPSSCPGERHTKTPLRLWHTNRSPNLGQKTRPYSNQQKKRTCKFVDFAVPVDYRIKLKESEKKDKYLDFERELKTLWNMKATIIPIVIGAFGTVTKGLLKGLEDMEVRGRVETIQSKTLLRTVRILRRVPETWGDLLSLKLQWKKHQLMLMWKTLKGNK